MAITKSITIDGKEVQFRASAAVPRMYRIRFRRDIFRDLLALQADIKASEDTGEKRMPEKTALRNLPLCWITWKSSRTSPM